MAAISVVQGRARVNAGVFTNPEDAKAFGGKVASDEDPTVQRAGKAWNNDLENIPMFLFLGLIYVLAGGPTRPAAIYFTVFTLSRIAHTITYLNQMQPWRTIVSVIA